MWLWKLFDICFPGWARCWSQAWSFVRLEEADSAKPHVLAIHQRIVRCAIVSGLVTSLAWTTLLVIAFVQSDESDGRFLFFTPVFAMAAFFAGLFPGASAGCAVSPTWFLLSPGERWIKLVGTRRMPWARIVCWAAAIGSSAMTLVPIACLMVIAAKG